MLGCKLYEEIKQMDVPETISKFKWSAERKGVNNGIFTNHLFTMIQYMLILHIIYYLISTITILEVVAIIFQITKFIAIKRDEVNCPLQQNCELEETNLNPDLVT